MTPVPTRPRAILFDLFNTLIPGGSRDERDKVSHLMAQTLGVDPAALADLVRETFDDRTRGRLGDLHATVTWLAQRLGSDATEADVDVAVQLRLELTRSLHQRTWAIPALVEIRSAGLLCGLVSDCSAETPEMWPDSPLEPYFDALSFSCVTGHRKPAPEAYLVAADELGVRPGECVFVGDGGSSELSGASAVGMRTIRYLPADGGQAESIDAETDWTGEVLADLADLLHVVS